MTSSYLKAQARIPFRHHFLPKDSSKENLDRFIPNRSAMDFDYAHFALTEGGREAIEKEEVSVYREAYRKQLAEALNLNRTRILAFRNKPPAKDNHSASSSLLHHQRFKPPRRIPQLPDRTLDAPGLVDDLYLNLVDWGSANVLAIALDSSVCLWDPSTSSVTYLVTYGEDNGPVTSVNWADDGVSLGVGLSNGEVDIWDCESKSLMRTLEGCRRHQTRVGSLAWNSHILTTGGMDGGIFNNDLRIRSSVVATYKGHSREVCGLKWSGEGLASGGKDGLVHIWDRSSSTKWLHRLRGHTSAVKALGWCPYQSHLLVSGGGEGDGKIKFWNTKTGACLNSFDTGGSQVSSLLWSNKEKELLTSHGSQLALWKYPSMVKIAELYGHTSSVLSMSQSPDGCTVVSAGGDERLMLWNAFGVPGTAKKPVPKAAHVPFSHVARSIR